MINCIDKGIKMQTFNNKILIIINIMLSLNFHIAYVSHLQHKITTKITVTFTIIIKIIMNIIYLQRMIIITKI